MIVDAWIAIAALAMFVYVALDGHDLGIGILMLSQRDAARRRQWIGLVNTTSDANESWIVLVAALLLAGVPGAYDVMLPTLYVPVTVMVLSLIVRRIALVATRSLPLADGWALLFASGSLTAAFAQGVAITAIVEKVSLAPAASTPRGASDFVSWYSVLGGVTAIAVYAVAGAIWAAWRADASVRWQARRAGALTMPVAAGLVALSAGLLPVTSTGLPVQWDGRVMLGVSAVLVASTLGVGWSSGRPRAWLVAAAIVVAEVLTLGVIVSMHLAKTLPGATNVHVGSPTNALYFILIAVAPCMPLVLFLNGYSLWSFHRKLVPSSAPLVAAVPSVESRTSPHDATPTPVSASRVDVRRVGANHDAEGFVTAPC